MKGENKKMTFEEFMLLEVGDGVIFDGQTATVISISNFKKNSIKFENGMKIKNLHSYRELTIAFVNHRTCKKENRYLVIYTDFGESELHNLTTLSRLSAWDPLEICSNFSY